MTVRRAFRLLVGAAVTGMIFGVALSGDDVVSAQAWIGASTATIVAVMIRDVVLAASVERVPISPAWTLAAVARPSEGPRGVQNMRSLLSSSQTSPRMFDRNLRPHLVDLVEHYLGRRHGFDPSHDTALPRDLLGDISWLIDPEANDRTPTVDELQSFLDVVVGKDGIHLPGSRPDRTSTT